MIISVFLILLLFLLVMIIIIKYKKSSKKQKEEEKEKNKSKNKIKNKIFKLHEDFQNLSSNRSGKNISNLNSTKANTYNENYNSYNKDKDLEIIISESNNENMKNEIPVNNETFNSELYTDGNGEKDKKEIIEQLNNLKAVYI